MSASTREGGGVYSDSYTRDSYREKTNTLSRTTDHTQSADERHPSLQLPVHCLPCHVLAAVAVFQKGSDLGLVDSAEKSCNRRVWSLYYRRVWYEFTARHNWQSKE